VIWHNSRCVLQTPYNPEALLMKQGDILLILNVFIVQS